jgi:hypothetical protein
LPRFLWFRRSSPEPHAMRPPGRRQKPTVFCRERPRSFVLWIRNAWTMRKAFAINIATHDGVL